MKEKNRLALKRGLEKLPEIDAPLYSWEEIENHLDFDKQLRKSLKKLPEYDPKDSGWTELKSKLDNEKSVKLIHLNNWYTYAASIAASLLIIITLYMFNSNTENISVHNESIVAVDFEIYESIKNENEEEAVAFIEQTCETKTLFCASEEFQLLKAQLDELSIEEESLELQLADNSSNQYLIKAHIRVENMKADVTKRLIQIITS